MSLRTGIEEQSVPGVEKSMPGVEKVAALDRVRSIVADVLEIEFENVEADSIFYDDLAADSLEKVEIVVRVERDFGVEISPDEAAGATSAAGVVALLRTKQETV
ncbi:acyl carrier protein [Streptomyces sp. NPDC087440]|uniref:acyl carrier protein n=1 Tax=Streptomyces sp. NPDC087440 TaxID=3365790 RepID=UPI00380BA301